MDRPAHRISRPGRRRHNYVALTLLALALPFATGGCGPDPVVRTGGGARLTVGAGRVAPPPVRMRTGARLARRAAAIYARGAYRRIAPRLPAEARRVALALAGAATRVPTSRRGLHPRLLALRIRPSGTTGIEARARIGGGGFPSFTIAIELRWQRRWRIASVSLSD